MKILLTGANGMVGKNILEHPHANQFTFLTPSRTDLDLMNYDAVDGYIKLHQPEMVIHAAGLVGGIQDNISRPVLFLVNNVDIGRNVIMAAKNNGVAKLLNLASSCMYPRNGKNPLSEDQILSGELEPTNEGYALAKIFATRLCEYIVKENPDLQYKTVIPSNLYGRFDKFDPKHSHMVPAVIRKIYEAKISNAPTVEIWGDGQSRREFMYAGDVADFLLFAIENFANMPQNLNVGLGTDYTIEHYYHVIAKIIGYEGNFVHDLAKPSGMRQKLIDNRLLTDFGWKHKTSLEHGVEKTYDYFKTTVLDD
ncbi:MAG TPA: GDP-L-fucose synthase [Flavobacterium sp.]|jgi:GDP-L-fucose synthase